MMDEGLVQLQQEIETQQQQIQRLQLALDSIKRDHERLSYSVSHDLQEPLRMVVNFVSLLQKRYEHLFDERGQEYIYYAIDGAKRMHGMIEQLLAYSRINSKGNKFQNINLSGCVDKVFESFRQEIKSCEVKMKVETLPELSGDIKQITMLFEHLIRNAIQYKSVERLLRIKINAKAKGAFWQFQVCDNGMGVYNENIVNMFDLFKRCHPDANAEGAGMGLALCKQIVRRHGGDIWAEANKKQGLCVCFTLLG